MVVVWLVVANVFHFPEKGDKSLQNIVKFCPFIYKDLEILAIYFIHFISCITTTSNYYIKKIPLALNPLINILTIRHILFFITLKYLAVITISNKKMILKTV